MGKGIDLQEKNYQQKNNKSEINQVIQATRVLIALFRTGYTQYIWW